MDQSPEDFRYISLEEGLQKLDDFWTQNKEMRFDSPHAPDRAVQALNFVNTILGIKEVRQQIALKPNEAVPIRKGRLAHPDLFLVEPSDRVFKNTGLIGVYTHNTDQSLVPQSGSHVTEVSEETLRSWWTTGTVQQKKRVEAISSLTPKGIYESIRKGVKKTSIFKDKPALWNVIPVERVVAPSSPR